MKIHFRLFLSHVINLRTQEKYSFNKFYYDFTAENLHGRSFTHDVINELRRLNQSKSFPALCHK